MPTSPVPPAEDLSLQERLSELVDGELSAHELQRLLAGDDELRLSWSCYQVIGDVLRGAGDGLAPARADRVASVMARVAQEPLPAAATLPAPRVRQAPANDALFRWKLVAGMACLAAVGTLTWQLVAQPVPEAGPQLVQAPLASPLPAVASSTEVVVPGELGPVIRDARLEELMAAHRQLGGVSALQMPAGFLRNATFENTQR